MKKLAEVFLKWMLGIGLVVYFLTGLYSIRQNELGVVIRFGAVVSDRVQPGIHYALPWPVDNIYKVPVKEVKTIVLDDFSSEAAPGSSAAKFHESTGLETYSITGDNNMVSISLLVKYTVFDPAAYLFNIRNAEELMRSLACSAVIHSLSSLPVDGILTYGKKAIEDEVRRGLQEKLDNLGSGLAVSFIEIKDVHPPSKVQSYFDDVINAKVDKKKLINEAMSRSNKNISSARADAAKKVQEANAYKKQKVDHALGDAGRFLSRLEEYSKAREATRKNLYLDFINALYPKLEQIIVVDNKKGKKLTNVRIHSGNLKP